MPALQNKIILHIWDAPGFGITPQKAKALYYEVSAVYSRSLLKNNNYGFYRTYQQQA
jgi:uncharacterized protein (DUF697 family)